MLAITRNLMKVLLWVILNLVFGENATIVVTLCDNHLLPNQNAHANSRLVQVSWRHHNHKRIFTSGVTSKAE